MREKTQATAFLRQFHGEFAVIEIENIHKRFGKVHAVQGVSFSAADGKITGLLGPNGAGKTTTLRVLSSLVVPDSGRVTVDNVDVQLEPRKALARLGMLPDSRGLYPRLSAREHLRYFGQLHLMDADSLEARIEDLSELLEMRSIIDRRVEGFSQGERTKVAIGRAIVHEPKNVVLDEATNGLDVMSARAVRSVVKNLSAEGMCVLFSSHLMEEVASLCDNLVVFRSGRVAMTGSPDELREQTGESDLEKAFVALVGEES